MSTTLVLPVRASLVDEVLPLLGPQGQDYSANAVIFQGKRPAHFLRRAIALSVGKSFVPPRIFSIDGFVEDLCAALSRPDLTPLDAAAVLFDIHSRTSPRLGGENFSSLDAFLPIGAKLFAAMEELYMAGVQSITLANAFSQIQLENTRLLGQMYEEFYAAVEEMHCSTRAMRYRAAAETVGGVDLTRYSRLIVAGFFGFTGAERQIMKSLALRNEVVFVFQDGPGLAAQMEEIGLSYSAPAAQPLPCQPHFHSAPDTHGEVFGLARKLHERIASGTGFDARSVIVLPSADGLFPVAEWVLPMFEPDTYNISLGFPANRTPVYGFISSLMQLVASMQGGKLYAPDYIKFVLHPYTKNVRNGLHAEVTRIMFHSIEQRLAEATSMNFFHLEEIEGDKKLHESVARGLAGAGYELAAEDVRMHLAGIHRETIRKFLSAVSIGDMAQKTIEILTFIDKESTARQHQYFRPFVLALMDKLDVLERSRLGERSLDDPGGYSAVLRTCLSSAEVPFRGTPLKGLQVLGLLETRNLHFDHVYLLDANDDVLPGIPDVDLFLPEGVRTILGLPGRRERERVTAYHFQCLIAGASEVHLFFREGGKKEKSRYVEQALWERQQIDRTVTTNQYIHPVTYGIELANKTPDPLPKSVQALEMLASLRFSASALDCYLRCPLQFHHRHLFGLREKDEVDGELDRAGVGRLVHQILADYDRQRAAAKGVLTGADINLDDLDTVVNSVFSQWFGPDLSGSRYLLREQVRSRLRSYLDGYRRKLVQAGPVQLLDVEKEMVVTKEGRVFRGIADRIEKRGEKIYIMDYKTGSIETHLGIDFDRLDPASPVSWRESIGSLQLPLYMMLYAGMHDVALEDIVPVYVMLGKREEEEELEAGLFEDGQDVRRKYEIAEQTVFALLKEIMDPATAFAPPQNLDQTCPSCAYARICGTQWVSGWRGAQW